MAILNGTSKPLPTSQIVGIQTMIPNKVTHPRSSRRVSPIEPMDTDLYKSRFHMILYYRKEHVGDSGWVFAGETKDSFGRAMVEQPIIGGRVWQRDDGMEIVSNDCGVRLVEAWIPVTLSEFLELKEKEVVEAELVFWKDLDEKHPQYCPLLYVQVTNFQCGGYSIGISCSLLLADPSSLVSFVTNWAKIHTDMISKNVFNKLPLHYLPNLTSANTNIQIFSDGIKSRNKTMIFTNTEKHDNHSFNKELVSLCIKEAESKLGMKVPVKLRLFLAKSFEEMHVETYFRESVAPELQNKLASVGWDHLGADEISFNQGNKPVSVSNWIYTHPGEVHAIVIPSSSETDSPMNIVVTIQG